MSSLTTEGIIGIVVIVVLIIIIICITCKQYFTNIYKLPTLGENNNIQKMTVLEPGSYEPSSSDEPCSSDEPSSSDEPCSSDEPSSSDEPPYFNPKPSVDISSLDESNY